MAHSNLHHVTEVELAGRWVAVYGGGGTGADGISLPSGAVIVDYDTELDLLCQRVAAAGQSGLTIYRYPGQHSDFLSHQGQYLPGHLPGSRGRA
jgi:hypothetical protein